MTKDEETQIITMDDGQSVELSDGRTVRFHIEPDQMTGFDDFEDFYGKIASAERVWDRHGERVERPDGFTGNAEKMWLQQNGGCIWWEPPTDVKRTDPSFAEFRQSVNDLASFGCSGYVLELCEGEDAYGHAIVKEVASLWGIEPFATTEYTQDILTDLLSELGLELDK